MQFWPRGHAVKQANNRCTARCMAELSCRKLQERMLVRTEGRASARPDMQKHVPPIIRLRRDLRQFLRVYNKDRAGRVMGNNATLRPHGRQKESNGSRFARRDSATHSGAEISAAG